MTTTRRLILIRHAKSGWDDLMADDHERTLTERGHMAAGLIGRWLQDNGYCPDLLLTSDAMRTQQTTNALCAALTMPPQIKLKPMLYHASPDTIADLTQRETAQTIAVVAHNPGIGMLANALVNQRPKHRRFDDYPTCATTVIDFPADQWMRPNQGTATAFTVPRDLT